MATSKTVEGVTPSGGVKSTTYFRDADGQPVDESEAVAAEVVEFAADGQEVARTYAALVSRE